MKTRKFLTILTVVVALALAAVSVSATGESLELKYTNGDMAFAGDTLTFPIHATASGYTVLSSARSLILMCGMR